MIPGSTSVGADLLCQCRTLLTNFRTGAPDLPKIYNISVPAYMSISQDFVIITYDPQLQM